MVQVIKMGKWRDFVVSSTLSSSTAAHLFPSCQSKLSLNNVLNFKNLLKKKKIDTTPSVEEMKITLSPDYKHLKDIY